MKTTKVAFTRCKKGYPLHCVELEDQHSHIEGYEILPLAEFNALCAEKPEMAKAPRPGTFAYTFRRFLKFLGLA